MLKPRLPVALLLLSVLSTSCTENGSPAGAAPLSDGASVTGINGPHTGEIWTADTFSGSNRFNLQTSQTIKVSDGLAYPIRNGSAYVEVFLNHESVDDEHCSTSLEDIHLFNVKDTRSGSVLGSFRLNRNINRTVRLSPDAEKIAMTVAEDSMDCDSNSKNKRFSIFSKNGEQLYRALDDKFIAFDWHPDGRLVIVRESIDDPNSIMVLIEPTPGSYKSHEFTLLLTWTRESEEISYIGFRVGPSGNDAVIEEVIDSAHFLTGFNWRNAKTHHFSLLGTTDETDMFLHDVNDTKPRVNAPEFSPDGKYILVTEGYSEGAAVFNPTSLDLNTLGINQTDELGTFSVLPVSSKSMSYIVPVDQMQQPMPPTQYSENIRPVLATQGDGLVSTVSFYPLRTVTWTPVID